MPTNDKNRNQGDDRSRQGSSQGSNQTSKQGDRKQQAGSTDRDMQSGLSGKSDSGNTTQKGSGSRSDSNR